MPSDDVYREPALSIEQKASGGVRPCTRCAGTGEIRSVWLGDEGEWVRLASPCRDCYGLGALL
jgi:DnaJ-class molecular chaperone